MNAPIIPPLHLSDLQSGLDYLAGLSLANPPVAERQLMVLLDELLSNPPDAGILLGLLEQARVPLCFVEEEMARSYHNKPVPLDANEESSFELVVQAWEKMGKAYALCAQLEKPETGNPQYAALMATILHRCLYYTGMIILEHYRARRELPAGIWVDLHGYFATAEEWGVAYTPVEDSLENNLQATHCAAAYATLLLIDVASPYSNSVRNLNLIRRWAGMWAPLISIHRVDDDLEVPPYIVELMKDAPLHPTSSSEGPSHDARRLDTTRIGLQINHLIAQLRQRMTPSQLGLGEDTSGRVMQLLEHLSRPWTQSASPRRFRRFATEGVAQLASGFEAMHFCVTGNAFEPPVSASTYSRSEFDQLFTFRDRVNPDEKLTITQRIAYPIESWSVVNHSANGFRLARQGSGKRINHAQLLSVCPHDGGQFLLVRANWLMQEGSGCIIVGVATLPGLPLGACIRPSALNGGAEEAYCRAFLLPALQVIKEEASIVLPAGMYQTARQFDVYSENRLWQLRLGRIVERGFDFDRVAYQVV